MAADKLRPKASEVWWHLMVLSSHPATWWRSSAARASAQIFVALALGAALHAFGDHLGLATLLVVLTLASMLGGISPVPGGMGVVEAGMILGLTAAGISETDAVAAMFVQRLFTAYLPPIWGWFVPGLAAQEGVPVRAPAGRADQPVRLSRRGERGPVSSSPGTPGAGRTGPAVRR